MNVDYELSIDSKYLVKMVDEEDIIGFFQGYSMIGDTPAIVFKICEEDKEKIRFIPVTNISYLDLIEYLKKEKKLDKKPEHLYG